MQTKFIHISVLTLSSGMKMIMNFELILNFKKSIILFLSMKQFSLFYCKTQILNYKNNSSITSSKLLRYGQCILQNGFRFAALKISLFLEGLQHLAVHEPTLNKNISTPKTFFPTRTQNIFCSKEIVTNININIKVEH